MQISATTQHVVSNDTSSAVDHVDLDKAQDAKADFGDHIAGYIFMCNTGTKPDCFTYRVFGLPASRLRDVEKIKPNTKLFLFDFEAKLLYGLYVADSSGALALEPYAFRGRFPAQVKFSIARDCLPLPEVAFKDAIKENYTGSKFKQELSAGQVNKLVSLFRPITVPSPKHPSPAFLDAVSSFYQKYVQTSEQDPRYMYMHDKRTVPEVSQVASADSYYGQIPMPRSTMSTGSPSVAPSSSVMPSSLRASQWVAVAAEALDRESQASNHTLTSSNNPSYAHGSYSGSDTRGVDYRYQDRAYTGSHQALSAITDQGVNNRPIHAYGMQPQSVSSYYTQIQGDSTLPRAPESGSSAVGVNNAHLYYSSTNHPASISYNYTHYQGDPALTQTQPSVSSVVGADNSYTYYNGTNPATLAYNYGYQGYYSNNQTAAPTTVQQVYNVPTYPSEAHQTYWAAAPPGYMN